MPQVRVGPGGVAVLTRCEDDGNVQLEVWAGDPGTPPHGWSVVFEGTLETVSRGFSAGTATASAFHINAAPGRYRVRAEARRDVGSDVDGVRFIFSESSELEGEILL
jgi:hypothetical protein